MSVEVNHKDRAHSPWGASSADRWMNCPGSVKLIDKAPPQKESKYASEGTCAHELAEITLMGSGKCEDYIGEVYEGHTVTEEMAEYIQTYVDYVVKAGRGDNKETIIEEKFHLDFIRKGLFGSNDACILEFMGTLEIIDLKYGKGKEVFAEDNKQLMYYALGAAHGSDFDKVKLTIIQPRVHNPIKSSIVNMERLDEFGKDLGVAVDATNGDNPLLSVGDHCFFCPAKSICSEQRKAVQATTLMDFEIESPIKEKSLPNPVTLDEQTLKNVLNHSDTIKKWLDSVRDYALHKLKAGEFVAGYKLVEGRANRKVSNALELEMAFGQEVYEKKLLGIGKLEKAFGKKQIAEFLYKPEPPITMARYEDKRPEVKVQTLADQFNEEIVPQVDNFDNFEF